MFTAIVIGLAIAQAIYAYANRPDGPRIRKEGAKAYNAPRTTEGTPVPLLWGKVRVTEPLLAHYFNFLVTSTDPERGIYNYSASMMFILGAPPYRADDVRVTNFWIGDAKTMWGEGLTHGGVYSIEDADALGGYGQGGGVVGDVWFYDGRSTQTLVGSDFEAAMTAAADDATILPGYRGQMVIAMPRLDFGESDSISPIAFEVAIVAALAGTETYSWEVPVGEDANPVLAIFDILTNPWCRLGLDVSAIDMASFEATADALADEGHGLSLFVADPSNARDLLKQIVDEIDAVLYEDPSTGLLSLKLIRDDYDHGTLPIFDESNIIGDPQLSSSQWPDTFAKVSVAYRSRINEYAAATAPAQDLANIASQGGRIRSLDIDCPGITVAATARMVAARKLKMCSTPLKRIRFQVNRDGYTQLPGSCFKFSWADFNGLSEMIFRTSRVDLGELGNDPVTIEAVQDIFGITDTIFASDDPWDLSGHDIEAAAGSATITPPPVSARYIVEAPRWLQRRAKEQGVLSDIDQQHLLYLAKPRNSDDASYGGVEQSTAAGDTGYVEDSTFVAFPARGVVSTAAYAREAEPYDTSTGLIVSGVTGTTPGTATEAQIRNYGQNLILVGSGADAELMAYESATVVSTHVYHLHNVWRGLADTVARDHAIGEPVQFVSAAGWAVDARRIGRLGFPLADLVSAKIAPRSASASLATTLLDADAMTITKRCVRPYPADDFNLTDGDGVTAKVFADYQTEGLDATWRERGKDADAASLRRGDDASATAGDTFRIYAQKGDFAEVDVTPGGAAISGAAAACVHLSKAGHGSIDVKLRTIDSGGLTSWQDPAIAVEAPTWRNLLSDPRFVAGAGITHGWVSTAGSSSTVGDSSALGGDPPGAGTGLRASSTHNQVTTTQTVDVSGYTDAAPLTAILDFYARNRGEAETVTVTLELLDAADSVLDTATYTGTPSDTQWEAHQLTMAMQATGAKLRVGVDMPGSAAAGAFTTSVVDGFCLRLGQLSAELLSNGSFDSAMTGWTTDAGSWSSSATGALAGGGCAVPGTNTTDTMHQTVTVPYGYEAGAVALLDWWAVRTAASTANLASMTMLALDGGGATLATSTVAAFAPATQDLWENHRQALTLPAGTASIKVSPSATKTGGAAVPAISFDGISLRLHKALESSLAIDADFTEPAIQYLPTSIERWWQDLGDVCPPPKYNIWTGATFSSSVGGRTSMRDNGVDIIDTYVGSWNGTGQVGSAYEFTADDLTSYDQFYAGSFGSSSYFAACAVVRLDADRFSGGCGVLGRATATQGWGVSITSGGKVRAFVRVGGVDTYADSVAGVVDGREHLIGIHYTASTGRLSVICDDSTAAYVDASAAGEFGYALPTPFRLGRAAPADTVFAGQMARVYMWNSSALLATPAQIADIWTHGADPSDLLGTGNGINAGDVVAGVVKAASTGAIAIARFAPGQYPVTYNAARDQHGLAISKAVTNLSPWRPSNTSHWTASGGTFASNERDVEGFPYAASLTATSANKLRLWDIDVSSTADTRVTFFARTASGSFSVPVELRDSANNLVDTETVALTTAWKRIDLAFTWNDATAKAQLWFYASGDGTGRQVILSNVVVHQDGAFWPVLLPAPTVGTGNVTAAVNYALAASLTTSPELAHEGEVILDALIEHTPEAAGALVDIIPASGSHNRRKLDLDASANLTSHVYNASGSDTSDSFGVTQLGRVRARWCRAGLLWPGTDMHQLVRSDAGDATYDDLDVTAIGSPPFTADDAAPLATLQIGSTSSGPANAMISRVQLLSREQERYSAVP